jgi:hypothetical protein
MDTILQKILTKLSTQNIIFNPDNQRIRCLAYVINLAAKKLIEDLHVAILYENEYDFEKVSDIEENLKNTIYKVSLLLKYY